MKSIIFSGQRSQYTGMLSTLKDDITVRNTFDRASFILGKDLWALCSDESIDQTDVAQPVLLTAGIALHRTIGCPAGIMAGHSLGEFIALTCAGAIDFEDALHLVSYRGQLMKDLGHPGCMAMIYGLTIDQVRELCSNNADIAAINSPLRISIAGEIDSVKSVVSQAIDQGAEWTDVWAETLPFHSRLMHPIVKSFRDAVDNIHIEVPVWSSVVSNVTGEIYSSTLEIRTNLVKHLTNTVHWDKCVDTIVKHNISSIIEIGARPLLAKLVLENAPTAKIVSIHDAETIDKYYNNGNL